MFLKAAIIYLLIGCIWGAVMTFPTVHEFLEAGPAGIIGGMHAHWNLLGWVTMAIIGGVYYLVPLIKGKELYSEKLAKVHFWVFNVLIVIGTVLGLAAGYLGGSLFIAERFAEIEATIGPYMMMISINSVVEAIVPNTLFAFIIYKTITKE
jgi:cytochrome c oxidase cbb3-type subunit 1